MRQIASRVPLAALAIIFILAVPRGAQAVSFGYFLRFHGITYSGTRFEEGRLLTPDDLGAEVGRVNCDVADLYSPASGSMAPSAASTERMQKCAESDGGASMLRPGTAIYSIRGYRPEYRLAANTGDQWMIFHASENARATVGADMLDLETKVDAVTLRLEDYLAPRNRLSVRVGTRADVETLISLVRAAPVAKRFDGVPPYYGTLSYRYWITFWFKDGTAHGVAYFPDTGWLSPGLHLDATFRRFVEDRLAPPKETPGSSPKVP